MLADNSLICITNIKKLCKYYTNKYKSDKISFLYYEFIV